MDPISGVVETLQQLYATWAGYFSFLSIIFDNFADYGTQQVAEAINQYATDVEPNATTTVVAVVYIVARYIPRILVLYVLFRTFMQRAHAIILSSVVQISITIFMGAVLDVSALPTEVYGAISVGPMKLYHGVVGLLQNDILGFLQALTVFVIFVVASYFLFFGILYGMWGVSAMLKSRPMFADASIRAHAIWLTLVWLFYVALEPGHKAFISTIFVLIVMVANRMDRSIIPESDDPKPATAEDIESAVRAAQRPKKRIFWDDE